MDKKMFLAEKIIFIIQRMMAFVCKKTTYFAWITHFKLNAQFMASFLNSQNVAKLQCKTNCLNFYFVADCRYKTARCLRHYRQQVERHFAGTISIKTEGGKREKKEEKNKRKTWNSFESHLNIIWDVRNWRRSLDAGKLAFWVENKAGYTAEYTAGYMVDSFPLRLCGNA